MKITNRASQSTLRDLNNGSGSRNPSVHNSQHQPSRIESQNQSNTISARDALPIHMQTNSTHRAAEGLLEPPNFNNQSVHQTSLSNLSHLSGGQRMFQAPRESTFANETTSEVYYNNADLLQMQQPQNIRSVIDGSDKLYEQSNHNSSYNDFSGRSNRQQFLPNFINEQNRNLNQPEIMYGRPLHTNMQQILSNVTNIQKQLENKQFINRMGGNDFVGFMRNQPIHQDNFEGLVNESVVPPDESHSNRSNVFQGLQQDVNQISSQIQNIMKILTLLQEFNNEQEKQNETLKQKFGNLEIEVDKKYKLFKAYTTHDHMQTKLEDMQQKVNNFEKMLQNKDKQHFLKLTAINKTINEKYEKHNDEIIQLQDKLKMVQYGFNTQKRVEMAKQIQGSEEDSSESEKSSKLVRIEIKNEKPKEEPYADVQTKRKYKHVSVDSSGDEASVKLKAKKVETESEETQDYMQKEQSVKSFSDLAMDLQQKKSNQVQVQSPQFKQQTLDQDYKQIDHYKVIVPYEKPKKIVQVRDESSYSDSTSKNPSNNSRYSRNIQPILKPSSSSFGHTFNGKNQAMEDTYKFRSISHQNSLKGSPIKSTLSAEKRYLRENSLEVKRVREEINQLNYNRDYRNVRLVLPKVDYTNRRQQLSDSQYSRHSYDLMPQRIQLQQRSPAIHIENQSMGNYVRASSNKTYDNYSDVARIDAQQRIQAFSNKSQNSREIKPKKPYKGNLGEDSDQKRSQKSRKKQVKKTKTQSSILRMRGYGQTYLTERDKQNLKNLRSKLKSATKQKSKIISPPKPSRSPLNRTQKTTVDRVEELQNEVDILKQSVVNQKAFKLKNEIRDLKAQLTLIQNKQIKNIIQI